MTEALLEKSLKDRLVEFLLAQGIDLHLNTKAHGHLGAFRENRIDIRKKLDNDVFIEVLLHEYAHFIHKKIESDMHITGGTLEKIFNTENVDLIEKELIELTKITHDNSSIDILDAKKLEIKTEIKKLDTLIKQEYPDFMRSKPFKVFIKYVKKSPARFLLKYDRVRVRGCFWQKDKIFSVLNLKEDFPDMPSAFLHYIKLNSLMRKSKNFQARKRKLYAYYEKPSELFARFIQCFAMLSEIQVKNIAPHTCFLFEKLLEENYYFDLKKLLAMLCKNQL